MMGVAWSGFDRNLGLQAWVVRLVALRDLIVTNSIIITKKRSRLWVSMRCWQQDQQLDTYCDFAVGIECVAHISQHQAGLAHTLQ
jgi:hypothetical protein